MKNINFFRILSIFVVSVVLLSCSKENLTLGTSKESGVTEKLFPINKYGGIAGTLTPTPLKASLEFYNEVAKFTASCTADQTGYFKIGTLIPGSYDITVAYVWNALGNIPVYEYRYFQLRGVIVEAGVINELGDVVLVPR